MEGNPDYSPPSAAGKAGVSRGGRLDIKNSPWLPPETAQKQGPLKKKPRLSAGASNVLWAEPDRTHHHAAAGAPIMRTCTIAAIATRRGGVAATRTIGRRPMVTHRRARMMTATMLNLNEVRSRYSVEPRSRGSRQSGRRRHGKKRKKKCGSKAFHDFHAVSFWWISNPVVARESAAGIAPCNHVMIASKGCDAKLQRSCCFSRTAQ